MATIKDIAKLAGVSAATVSYVLNNTRYVSPEKKERVYEAIRKLNYVPNAVARGLRVRESRALGLILSDITHPFYPELAKGCEDMAQSRGYSVVIMNTDEREDRMAQCASAIREGRMDGLIIASAFLSNKDFLLQLKNEGYPLVMAHRCILGLDIDSVSADNVRGAREAVRYLVQLGHRKIALIMGSKESPVTSDRLKGYLEVLKENGIQVLPEWIVSGNNKYEFSYEQTRKLLSFPSRIRPTAILATSDIGGMGILDAASDLGIGVPDELSVIGFDDLLFSNIRSVQLTTVRVPRYEMGYQAAKVLIDRLNKNLPDEPVNIVLDVELIVRATCGACNISA